MICAAANNNLSTARYYENTTMMSAEEYYNQNDLTKNKLENMYNMNNNNTIMPNESTLNQMTDKMALLSNEIDYTKINGQSANPSIDEQRALQLALELSMLGLTTEDELNYNDLRIKKSMNMTECVPVPSSEHVAEIVGRQGKFIFFYFIT